MKDPILLEQKTREAHISQPKILFIDLDGTVVNSSGEISEPVKQSVSRIQAQGVKVAIATGRPYFAAKNIIRELNISSPSMFFSGALIVNPSSEEIHYREGLSPDQVKKILTVCQKLDLFCELYARTEYFISHCGKLSDIHLQYLHLEPTVCELGEKTEDILKTVIVIDRTEQQDFEIKSLKAELPDLHLAAARGASHPDIEFINVTSPSASRQRCFEEFLKVYSVRAEDVMAIGDATADIPFLELAGTGVAMGNAEGAVKQAANYVTRHVDQDGFAYAMDLLVPPL
jgi:Cof subfamily protein (haloacid dehalogenase superfamily)